MRVGARVPIASGSNINYENIGTSIDCSVYTKGQGLFRTEISLEESSVYFADPPNATQAASPTAGRPIFRSFKVTNGLVLKDGQTTQMTSAADPVTGEVMRVDLTLTVVK